jgi:hypothetical protein
MRYPFRHVDINALCFALILAVLCPLHLRATPQHASVNITAPSGADPDKPSSEMNHHIAGIFLVAIGLSVILSKHSPSLAWLKWLYPLLFIGAGIFLAVWSDSEIWPRGNLNWLWLLRHDAEARQHKLYALLLIAFGLLEYVQASPRFRRPWLGMVFPALCVLGGVGLFFHHHSGMAVAHANAIEGHHSSVAMDISSSCQSAQEAAPAGPQEHDHHAAADLSRDCPSSLIQADTSSMPHEHAHALTRSGANVQRQHAWFAIVGFCVALFKLLHDVPRPSLRVSSSLWANSIILLGILLLLYVE